MTWTNRGRWCACRVGIGRRPPSAIVAATSVISSAEVSTLPWPIAEEPTSSGRRSSLAEGILLSAAPGIDGGWLKPKRSAIRTSRAAPTLTPSGANTELHETANAFRNVPPHASPLAFWSV